MAELTFEQFWQRLIAVEKRVNANSVRFEGFQLYPILRVRIFYALATALGIFDAPHPVSNRDKEAIEPLLSFDGLEQSPVIVLPFRRLVGGVDPYSQRIIELLTNNHDAAGINLPGATSLAGASRGAGAQKSLGGAPSVLSFDVVDRLRAGFKERWGHEAMTTLKGANMAKFAPKWAKFIDALQDEFGVTLDTFAKYPPMPLRLAWIESKGFAEYFKAVGAKHLYIVNAYSEQSIVLGAKLAGVKVHEIQHGFITKMHPAYAYPTSGLGGLLRQRIDHAPDSLLTWGSYWTDGVRLPAGTKPIVTGPTAAFTEYKALATAQNRIVPKTILFTSQGAVATELLTAALNTTRQLPDHHITYRLHPNENLDDYQALAQTILGANNLTDAGAPSGQFNLPHNFGFSHKDPIFLDLVSQSEYLVGAFSTTLYEGLALGCKVLVLPLPGFEHVQQAISLGDMTLVDSLEELPKYLSEAKQVRDTSRYYSSTN